MNNTQMVKIGTQPNTLVFFKMCSRTQEEYAVTVDFHAWQHWKGGMLIQDAMPGLKPEERAFLMSGLTPAEVKYLYSPQLDADLASGMAVWHEDAR